ncbi:MAG: ribosome maturation factor RimP [Caldimonas sp.]
MNWLASVERTVTGLGYELVEVEHAARGLLRVTIDRVPGTRYPTRGAALVPQDADADADADAAGGEAAVPASTGNDGVDAVTVEDCERVTRQLQYVLEVDGVDYQRLEVSSPGLDRPLKREADYRRFAGEPVRVTFKLPFQGRKGWSGVLRAQGDGWRLELDEGQGGGKDAEPGARSLDFRLDEVREARLVPVLDFKGRKARKAAGTTGAEHDAAASPAAHAGVHGGLER